jgi:hypothetical protein
MRAVTQWNPASYELLCPPRSRPRPTSTARGPLRWAFARSDNPCQRAMLKPNPVAHNVVAARPRPFYGVLALLDPMLGRPADVAGLQHSVCRPPLARDDEVDPPEQLVRGPPGLSHHALRGVPAGRLTQEVVKPDDRLSGRATRRMRQQRLDLLLQHRIRWQPDGVELAQVFQVFVAVVERRGLNLLTGYPSRGWTGGPPGFRAFALGVVYAAGVPLVMRRGSPSRRTPAAPHQPQVPAAPLKGPTTRLVIQPP